MADNGFASSALQITVKACRTSGGIGWAGGTYFFTVNLLERKNDLLVRHVTVLRDAVRVVGEERPFHPQNGG